MPQLIVLFVLLALAPSLVLAQASAPATPGSDGTPITFGTSHRIDSAILGDSRTLNVWLPPGLDTAETPYTVLYRSMAASSRTTPTLPAWRSWVLSAGNSSR